MIQSTITRYFQKNEYNLKKVVDMDVDEEMSTDIKKEMNIEIKGELNLDWDEVDNYHGQIFDNIDKNCTLQVVLEKLPESLLKQKFTENLEKNLAPTTKQSSKHRPKCAKCKRTFKNENSIMSHKYFCGKERNIECEHCSYKTKYKTSLVVHLSKVHKNGKNIESPDEGKIKKICEKCKETAATLCLTKCEKCFCKLSIHCAKCNKQFKTRSLAEYHWFTRCGVRGYFNCPKCDFKSVWRSKVVHHMKRSHTSQDISEEFKNIEWLDLKIEKENSESDQYRCTKCAKSMGSLKKLSNHIFSCGGSECTKNSNARVNRCVESEAIKCSKCGKEFNHVYSLNKHSRYCMGRQNIFQASDIDVDVDINVVDLNEDLPVKPLVSADERCERYIRMTVRHCGKCEEDSPMEFKSWGMGKNPLCHKCNKTLLFKCKKCLITKVKYSNLKRHIDSVCDPQEEFKCTKCNYKSFTYNILKGHHDTVHGTANVPCEKCGRKFKSMSYLKRHLHRCGAELKFQCAHCPYKARQKMTLMAHIFRNHTERVDIIDRGEAIKISRQRFSRAKLHLNAFCSKCKKEQLLSKRFKICQICKTKLYYKCKTCKNKYDVDDENACIHVKSYLETIKFQCKRCGKGAISEKSIVEHERTCGLEPMFKCRFCKYASKTKNNTVKHEKVKHPHKF